MVKKKVKNNYLKLAFILIGVTLVTLISANLYQNIVNTKINSGYLTKYISSISYNEISNAKVEFSGDTFLYISYTGDKSIYNLDVKLKKVVEETALTDQLIYLDMKEYLKDKELIEKLNNSLATESMQIKKLPAIMYFRDDKLIEIIDSENQLLQASDFHQLLDKYEITNT